MYRSLNVPINRLEQDQSFTLGMASEISREEVKFQKFIDRLRKRFSMLFTGILKKQLLLKNLITEQDWESWKNNIQVDFQRDNHFTELKNAEVLSKRLSQLDNIQDHIGEYFSREWVMKNVMMMNDETILQKCKLKLKDENAVPDKEESKDNEQ